MSRVGQIVDDLSEENLFELEKLVKGFFKHFFYSWINILKRNFRLNFQRCHQKRQRVKSQTFEFKLDFIRGHFPLCTIKQKPESDFRRSSSKNHQIIQSIKTEILFKR